MTKEQYLDFLEKAEQNEILGILSIANNDTDLNVEELGEISNIADKTIEEYQIAKAERQQEIDMYGEMTDDELGLTQI